MAGLSGGRREDKMEFQVWKQQVQRQGGEKELSIPRNHKPFSMAGAAYWGFVKPYEEF